MSDNLRGAAQAALETLEDVFGKDKIDVSAINNLRAALAEPVVKESLTTHEEFQEYVRAKCLYETIYSDSNGREILIIRMLDAYALIQSIGRTRCFTQGSGNRLREKNSVSGQTTV